MLTDAANIKLGVMGRARWRHLREKVWSETDRKHFEISTGRLNDLIEEAGSLIPNGPCLTMDDDFELQIFWELSLDQDIEVDCLVNGYEVLVEGWTGDGFVRTAQEAIVLLSQLSGS